MKSRRFPCALTVMAFHALWAMPASAQVSPIGLTFDGVDDVVLVDYDSIFEIHTGDFTIEAWIRDDAQATGFSEEEIFSTEFYSNYQTGRLRLCIQWGQLTAFVGGTACYLSSPFNTPDLRDGACHHVAISRSAGTVTGYVDGFATGSQYAPDSIHSLYFWTELKIGCRGDIPGSYFDSFNGMIKEVRFWNSARSWLEIFSYKDSVLQGAAHPSLIGYWRFNEGSGDGVIDHSMSGTFANLGSFDGQDSSDPAWSTGCPSCPPPSAAITYSGSPVFCSGDSLALTANAGTGLSYQWLKDGSAIQGAVAASYQAKSTGNYAVMVGDACGDSVSASVSVTVKPLPGAAVTPAGPITLCKPATVTLTTVVAANRSYQWKRNGVIIPGATASSLVVTQSGYYKVVVTNTNTGCSKTTGTATHVSIFSKPAAKITPSGTISFCAGQSALLTASSGNNYSYQWKKDGALIPGATSQTLTVTAAGLYKVIVTKANGCSKVSKADTVVVPCREVESFSQLENDLWVTVHPNPSHSGFTISIDKPENALLEVKVFDVKGRTILEGETKSSSFVIDAFLLEQGFYFTVVTMADKTKTIKLVKH